MLDTLVRSCKLINDRVQPRLPIHAGFLEQILFEIERIDNNQYYLEIPYKTMLLFGYYGLLRIGEIAKGPHCIKAANVHVGQNKKKLLIILYSSKTHGAESRPQRIKITANDQYLTKFMKKRCFCPFSVTLTYLKLRGFYCNPCEQFFVFRDNSPVSLEHVCKTAIKNLNVDHRLYDCHSL